MPFQQNIQFGIGPANAGWQDLMNIQPVVPFSISRDWNLIARMIMPVVYQDEIFPGAGSQFGIGDTTFQFFFSPKAPTKERRYLGGRPVVHRPLRRLSLVREHVGGRRGRGRGEADAQALAGGWRVHLPQLPHLETKPPVL